MQSNPFLRRAWLEVDLDRLAQNLAEVRRRIPASCEVIAVIKADGYGQGQVPMARRLAREGVHRFAVASLSEALELRRAGIAGEILILAYTHPDLAALLVEHDLTQAVGHLDYARALNGTLRGGKRLAVHLKLDTGMTRTGFDCRTEQELEAVAAAYALPQLEVTGVFSHFSSSDDGTAGAEDYCAMQLDRYLHATQWLQARGLSTGLRHMCNTGGIQKYPQAHFDAVRAGAILSGYGTAHEVAHWTVTPITALKATISQLRNIEAGTAVSYSRTFRAEHPMRVAVVCIGYADGYPRGLSRRSRMLVNGRWARQLGNVCMDQLMIDVTDIPDVKAGDVAVILGQSGALRQDADALAACCDSCMHEILSRLGARLQRLYLEDGKVVEIDR